MSILSYYFRCELNSARVSIVKVKIKQFSRTLPKVVAPSNRYDT